jgi:hypothetical protein
MRRGYFHFAAGLRTAAAWYFLQVVFPADGNSAEWLAKPMKIKVIVGMSPRTHECCTMTGIPL